MLTILIYWFHNEVVDNLAGLQYRRYTPYIWCKMYNLDYTDSASWQHVLVPTSARDIKLLSMLPPARPYTKIGKRR